MITDIVVQTQMRCDECGTEADARAAGWAGVYLDLPDDPDPPEVAIFCAACRQREFGGDLPGASPRLSTHRDGRSLK